MTDIDNAELSAPYLARYIRLLLDSPNPGKFHIIAHSMGNVVLCKALRQLHDEKFYPTQAIVQIILAAPDIDRDIFTQQLMPAIRKEPNITLYASDNDKALQVSKAIRSGNPRLGEGGTDILVMDGMDSVDASQVATDLLGHGYFAATESLLNDIHEVLMNIRSQKRRLKSLLNAARKTYWAFQRT